MLTMILMGLARHILTSVGGMLLAHGLQFVDGFPVVHDMTSAVTGGLMALTGAALSAAQKVKTKSGADYSGLNQ